MSHVTIVIITMQVIRAIMSLRYIVCILMLLSAGDQKRQ